VTKNFGQNFQLRLEISLIDIVFVYRNYVIPLLTLKNHVFTPFMPYLALIWPSLGQTGKKV